MRKIVFVTILCILAAILVGYAAHQTSIFAPSTTAPEYQSVLVTQVVDGDTITVEGGMRVRLIGIDAPERDEEYYTEAKEYLKGLILHKEVDLEKDITDKDQYGRSLRYVWLDNKLVNAEIVRAGFAIAKQYDPDVKYQRIIADAEQDAIEKQVGKVQIPTTTPTRKIKELDISVDERSGDYTAVMSFSTPSPGFVYVQLTDQDGNELWRELITESPVTLEAGFSHTNLEKLILNRYESNAYEVTSYIFEVYWSPTPTGTPTPSPTKTKWKSSDEGVISYLDADKYIGQTKTVEGTIVKTFKYTKGKIIFLNFHDPYQGYFTAIIWSSDWDNFPFAPEVYYKGKEVRVTGEIIEYEGSPEIVVRTPSQIEVAFGG